MFVRPVSSSMARSVSSSNMGVRSPGTSEYLVNSAVEVVARGSQSRAVWGSIFALALRCASYEPQISSALPNRLHPS